MKCSDIAARHLFHWGGGGTYTSVSQPQSRVDDDGWVRHRDMALERQTATSMCSCQAIAVSLGPSKRQRRIIIICSINILEVWLNLLTEWIIKGEGRG